MAKHRIKTPTLVQMETAECGATALGIILSYYGKWINQEELRETCDVSRDGVKASNIVQAAKYYGLQAEGYRLEIDELYAQVFPLIVFWNFNHFVVVEGYNNKYVFINDPAVGPRKVSKKEFSESYTGIAILLEPGPSFKKSGHKPKASKLLIHWLRGTKQAFILLAVITLLLVIPSIAMSAFLKVFIDEVLVLHYNTWLFPLIIGIIASTILTATLVGLQQYLILRIRTKLGISSASQFFWHILNLPMRFFEQRYIGNIAARINSCENIANLLSGPVASSAINVFTVLIFLIVMWFFSVPLTLLVMVVCLLNITLFLGFQRRLKDTSLHSINQAAKWNSISLMGVQTIDNLKANGSEADFFARWSGHQASTINSSQQVGIYSAILSTTPSTFGSITNACVYGLGAYLVIQGELTIGTLIAFTSLLTHVTNPLNQFIGFAAQFQQINGDVKRLQDAMHYKRDPLTQIDAATDTNQIQLAGQISFKDVNFAFNQFDEPFLRQINLAIKPGQRIGIVGKTGCGKSTLAKLLLGLQQPTSGQITYDDTPIELIPRSLFTSQVAWVDQKITSFSGTIKDNLTMWNESVSEQTMIQAAMDACIHDMIAARPGGYSSLVEENQQNFSGGQIQRLEIAKALMLNPAVIVLDEATSALDAMTEHLVSQNLKNRGCTTIMIAHRLSTIQDCDEIIVLDKGEIKERGTHQILMAMQGLYAELIKSM